jgi:hypothetical protein
MTRFLNTSKFEIEHSKFEINAPRQKKSFGQKRRKQWWPRAVAGHSNFRLKRGL